MRFVARGRAGSSICDLPRLRRSGDTEPTEPSPELPAELLFLAGQATFHSRTVTQRPAFGVTRYFSPVAIRP